jgi:16S rRNA (uracil1498-N3)-methyltransferase
VSPRGDGDAFERKARARMISALEQSGGAWLPVIEAVREVDATVPRGSGFALERGTFALGKAIKRGPVSLAVGPEGGFEPDELKSLVAAGWATAALGDVTLRFETAAVAAIAIARSLIDPEREG